MKILILASSRYAPTYNEKLKKQVAYINAFDNIEAELYNDLPLYEIEKKLLTQALPLHAPNSKKNAADSWLSLYFW